MRTNGTTLKANIVGLGNYINNINGDVGKLASTFEKYIAEVKEDIEDLKVINEKKCTFFQFNYKVRVIQ